MAGGGDRPEGGDGEKTEAKVGREGHRLGAVDTVLGAAGSADGGRVGGETLTVSVMRLDVGGLCRFLVIKFLKCNRFIYDTASWTLFEISKASHNVHIVGYPHMHSPCQMSITSAPYA